ncbi:hypothetical protein OH77DRAFT_1429557 [Trametes cingulata]|nr:hypothetical protein OH77DRAFT_1429557 [Trametes cingulata]
MKNFQMSESKSRPDPCWQLRLQLDSVLLFVWGDRAEDDADYCWRAKVSLYDTGNTVLLWVEGDLNEAPFAVDIRGLEQVCEYRQIGSSSVSYRRQAGAGVLIAFPNAESFQTYWQCVDTYSPAEARGCDPVTQSGPSDVLEITRDDLDDSEDEGIGLSWVDVGAGAGSSDDQLPSTEMQVDVVRPFDRDMFDDAMQNCICA